MDFLWDVLVGVLVNWAKSAPFCVHLVWTDACCHAGVCRAHGLMISAHSLQ